MPAGAEVSILSPITEQATPVEPSVRPITLIETAQADRVEGEGSSLDVNPSDPTSSPEFVLERRWTKTSLQRQLTARKYARYQEHRLVDRSIDDDDTNSLVTQSSAQRPSSVGRLTKLFARKKIRQTREEDIVVDVLYENQRGTFTFGVPHFSANSLLNFDPKPWTNAHHRTSPVNITNAQVPDPNWEWAWDSWYVDMSRDVDEQGWEYSLWFQNGTAWHGNHPWFHSFVRRRRWLRKRVRRTALRPTTPRVLGHSETDAEAADIAQVSYHDTSDLLKALRSCSIDRERLRVFRRYISAENSDLEGLHGEMAHIMGMLVFQESRRKLLDALVDKQAECDQQVKETVDSRTELREHLNRVVHVAKHQVEQLEFWSDVKSTALQKPEGAECAAMAGVDLDWVVLPSDSADHLYRE